MRELKFRAWDKVQSKYIEVVRIQFSLTRTPILITQELSDKRLLTDPASMYVIEQYTGLKDKYGEEIYEGDILTLNGEWEEIEYGDYSIVTFENGCFRIGDGYNNEVGSYLSDWRIIGNIHENPELVEEEE